MASSGQVNGQLSATVARPNSLGCLVLVVYAITWMCKAKSAEVSAVLEEHDGNDKCDENYENSTNGENVEPDKNETMKTMKMTSVM